MPQDTSHSQPPSWEVRPAGLPYSARTVSEMDELLQDLIEVQASADCVAHLINLRVEFDPDLNRHVLKLPEAS